MIDLDNLTFKKGFSFKSKTILDTAARIHVTLFEEGILHIHKVMVITENPCNFKVLRKFKNYMVVVEPIAFREASFFNIVRGLYDLEINVTEYTFRR